MSYFLVIYDRMRRSRPSVEQVDADQAPTRLFEIEHELLHDPNRGVVLLVAEREEELETTHGQYFKTLDELGELVS